jgi:Glycosyltransferase
MFPDKPVFVLTNAVNFQEMADTKGVRRGKDNLLYLGWYIRAKGIYELVDAVEIMVGKGISVHLNFYGTKEIDHLCEYVNNKNLTSYITVSGWIGEKEKLQALYESTLLVLPSHTEGIPNVILEAMATRTPLVATSVGGLKDILRDGENALIVEVNNPTDLSNKICRLLNDDELRRHLAENAYREAAEKYDVRVIKKQFFHIIEQGIG